MNTRTKKILISIAAFSLISLVAIPLVASADLAEPVETDLPTGSLSEKIKAIVNQVALIIASICVLIIIFGGIMYAVSGGKEEQMTSAKNIVIYAVVGLIIVALAWVLVGFVVKVMNIGGGGEGGNGGGRPVGSRYDSIDACEAECGTGNCVQVYGTVQYECQ